MDVEQRHKKRYLKLSPFNQNRGNPDDNACVGVNGRYNQLTIYEGFKDAVYAMLHSVACYESPHDTMIYPILYSVRHSIELFLKELYRSILFLKCIRENSNDFNKWNKERRRYSLLFDLHEQYDRKIKWHDDSEDTEQIAFYKKNKGVLKQRLDTLKEYIDSLESTIFKHYHIKQTSHDLDQIIRHVQGIYDIEPRIKELFDTILPILGHYKAIDPDGDMFRYWSDIKDIPHFEKKNITTVNIAIVCVHFDEITDVFGNIEHLMTYLRREYNTGTFTKELSRAQIEAIAKKIPLWPDEFKEKIKEVKKQIIKEYCITSKAFDHALCVIRKHREFAMHMGCEIVFSRLSNDAIRIFVECFVGKADMETVSKKICEDELILLFTFSEISGWRYGGSDSFFSEDLDNLYSYNKRNHKGGINCHDFNRVDAVNHVMMGMEKCGQKTYASILEQYIAQYREQSVCK